VFKKSIHYVSRVATNLHLELASASADAQTRCFLETRLFLGKSTTFCEKAWKIIL